MAYEDVRWGTVTPATVSIFYKTGVATIRLERLSPDLQRRFGYDAQKAIAYDQARSKNTQQVALVDVYHKDIEEKLLIAGHLTATNQMPFRYVVGFIRERTAEGLVVELAKASGGGATVFGGPVDSVGANSKPVFAQNPTRYKPTGEDALVLNASRTNAVGNLVNLRAFPLNPRGEMRVYDCGRVPTFEEWKQLRAR